MPDFRGRNNAITRRGEAMQQKSTQGFSLIEVLVAIGIFGIMLGGVFTAINRGNSLLSTSADVLQARLLANTTMETMKIHPFEDLESHSFVEMTSQGRMTVDVDVSDFKGPTLKKIEVAVQWEDHHKQSRELTLSTLRSQYSLEN
jgi:prepilin-type N-terminal cleavage/methylation domain-containing protein